MTGARLPRVGELVEFCSLFECDRIIGIVVWVPDEQEIREKIEKNTQIDAFFFKVITKGGVEDYWAEYEWNYIDTEDDEETKN